MSRFMKLHDRIVKSSQGDKKKGLLTPSPSLPNINKDSDNIIRFNDAFKFKKPIVIDFEEDKDEKDIISAWIPNLDWR